MFAATVQAPPFLSQVATMESSEYFAMFSNGAADGLVAQHSTDWLCESRYA
jgi:hypothetical protein